MASASGTRATRPLPGSGKRAFVSPRAGRARPDTTATTRMISSGTARGRPVSDAALTCHALARSGWNNESSLCNAPMTRAAATVTGNDENRPTSAAANAGSTATDRIAAFNVTIGASRMAASADKKPAIT